MTLAQRIRDQRYAKGWGPDELASRAAISRTALYQIESGKTEHPRAATVRRLAEALEVSTDQLLQETSRPTVSPAGLGSADRAGAPPEIRFASKAVAHEFTPRLSDHAPRDLDLARKVHELINSPLGEGFARIVEESYRILPEYRIGVVR